MKSSRQRLARTNQSDPQDPDRSQTNQRPELGLTITKNRLARSKINYYNCLVIKSIIYKNIKEKIPQEKNRAQGLT